MATRAALLTALGLGLGLVYFLDPQRGRQRRALLRDAAVRTMHAAGDAADMISRDLRNRAVGTAAELGALVTRDDADDDTVVARVRAKLGRVVSHPHAIHATASSGVVTLTGPILQAEVPRLLHTVERVRGVREVINQLEEHNQPGNIPSLQGGTTRGGIQPDLLQRQWAPATRFIVGAGALSIAALGAQRRDMPGWLMILGGLGLLARAATNLETKRLVGVGAVRRAIDLQQTNGGHPGNLD